MKAPKDFDEAVFADAVERIKEARYRRELHVAEIAAPAGVTERSLALSARVLPQSGEVADQDESALGAGRLILLHDPNAAAEWGGDFRFVCYVQAPLETEISVDPLISEVAWSWLLDALERKNVSYSYASGTATKIISTGFGALETKTDVAQLEMRASWTPQDLSFDLHAEAWAELLCMVAGLPDAEGVASLEQRRAQRKNESGD